MNVVTQLNIDDCNYLDESTQELLHKGIYKTLCTGRLFDIDDDNNYSVYIGFISLYFSKKYFNKGPVLVSSEDWKNISKGLLTVISKSDFEVISLQFKISGYNKFIEINNYVISLLLYFITNDSKHFELVYYLKYGMEAYKAFKEEHSKKEELVERLRKKLLEIKSVTKNSGSIENDEPNSNISVYKSQELNFGDQNPPFQEEEPPDDVNEIELADIDFEDDAETDDFDMNSMMSDDDRDLNDLYWDYKQFCDESEDNDLEF